MNTEILTFLSLLVSFAALLYLRNSDPKLRRVYGLSSWGTKRYVKQALFICLAPGIFLLLIACYSAFIMWFAAFSLVGWIVAWKKPVDLK